MDVRLLTEHDAAAFHTLRLIGLRESPTAFGASVEEEASMPPEVVAARLRDGLPDNVSFGAFVDQTLVGIVGLVRQPQQKAHHWAMIVGLYVAPAARQQGVGRRLVLAALDYARSQPGLEAVTLAVSGGNLQARRLYESLGFVSWGVHPRRWKIGDVYHDLEWMHLSLDGNRVE